jgi:HD-like signal output (HDOD) protein
MAETNNGYTTIRISKTTHELISSMCPKKWDYDRFILEIAKVWQKEIGKHPKLDSESRINP